MSFNNQSRSKNALFASVFGVLQQVLTVVGNFVYRTVFLMLLSKEYLGISGLFSNILQILSLAELGIGSAIVFSMYKPFADQDTKKIAALIRFYKNVYHMIGLVIALLGLCLYPFLSFFVDFGQIPSDVNITLVYFLFVLQSVVSYLFVYKQSLLIADQRNHLVLSFTGMLTLASFAVRIAALVMTKNFALMLLCDVIFVLLCNFLFSIWITKKYRDIFRIKERLTKEEKSRIYRDTGGLLCHKIGSVVVSGTDSIVLSKFVSLISVAIYSNYATIISAISNVAVRVFSSVLPSVANFIHKKTKEESSDLFYRLFFANMWIASFTTICLYLLLNPFIQVWLDESFLLPQSVVIWICIQHYLQVARLTANNFINACGLFMRDRIRPLIESVLNLVISVVLALRLGIVGVFIGTVVSGAFTYFWREPHLVFRCYFEKKTRKYWLLQLAWFALTAVLCVAIGALFAFFGTGFSAFVIKCVLALILSNCAIFLCVFRTQEFGYYFSFLKKKLSTVISK